MGNVTDDIYTKKLNSPSFFSRPLLFAFIHDDDTTYVFVLVLFLCLSLFNTIRSEVSRLPSSLGTMVTTAVSTFRARFLLAFYFIFYFMFDASPKYDTARPGTWEGPSPPGLQSLAKAYYCVPPGR